MRRTRAYLAITVIILAACAGQRSAPTVAVTVQLKWTHQAQFAGFYAAQVQGYYAGEGLQVSFLEGGPDVDLLGAVGAGEAQFGVADAAQLILARAEGQPLRAIGVIYRRNPLVLISMAEAGVTRPEDLIGKSVRITPEVAPAFHTLMARAGITPDKYVEVNAPNSLEAFAAGDPVVWAVYTTGFGLVVERAGYAINKIHPDDYGVHFYADTIFTSEALIAREPDLVMKFLRASLRGWTYAVEHTDEVAALVSRYDPRADLDLESAKMLASLPLIYTGEGEIGGMEAKTWVEMVETLREQGQLSRPLEPEDVFTMKFLTEIYP